MQAKALCTAAASTSSCSMAFMTEFPSLTACLYASAFRGHHRLHQKLVGLCHGPWQPAQRANRAWGDWQHFHHHHNLQIVTEKRLHLGSTPSKHMITVSVTCCVAPSKTALHAVHQPSVSAGRSSLGVTITGLQCVTETQHPSYTLVQTVQTSTNDVHDHEGWCKLLVDIDPEGVCLVVDNVASRGLQRLY